MDDELFLISMAAEVLGMHPQTLRKYERMGLVRPPRTVGSMRLYSRDELERLRRIKHLVDGARASTWPACSACCVIGEAMQRIRPLMDERALTTEGGRRRLLAEMRRLSDAVGL